MGAKSFGEGCLIAREDRQGAGLGNAQIRGEGREDSCLVLMDPPVQFEIAGWITSWQRRSLDCMVAGAALLALSPLLLLLALFVRLTSCGPALFRQRRMGRNGVEFTLFKFRSMRVEEGCGAHVTVAGDPRITPMGAFLRRFKLDELPQFWNVLKGDMSLVGPRPKLPHHEGLYLPCRPGITGAATLAFRREEELLASIPANELDDFYEEFIKPNKARLDLEYIQSATLPTDLRLLWETVASCLGIREDQPIEEWRAIYDQARAERILLSEEAMSAY